ncbi:MAG: hypothetical protein QM775_00065 [Pirellulales bacterium]
MSKSDVSSPDPNAAASDAVMEELRKLGLTHEWSSNFRPTYGELLDWEGPASRNPDRSHGRANDATLDVLRFVPRLRSLDISSTDVTDDGMATLRYVPELECIDLTNTIISDKGVRHLTAHRRLRRFVAMHARVTIVGERMIQSSAPGCDASIGRQIWSGVVRSFEDRWLTMEDRSGRIHTAYVGDRELKHFADELADPVGRRVGICLGEPPERNFFRAFYKLEPSSDS